MAIAAIMGKLGSGKTYTAVMLARQEHLAGRAVYANSHITFARQIVSWPELVSLRHGLFIWTEAHLDLDSRQAHKHVGITAWLTQVRKLGIDIIYDTQDFGQVDVRLRNLTDMLLLCSPASGSGGRRGTRLQVFDLFDNRRRSDSIYEHSPDVYALYNSWERILPLAGEIPPDW